MAWASQAKYTLLLTGLSKYMAPGGRSSGRPRIRTPDLIMEDPPQKEFHIITVLIPVLCANSFKSTSKSQEVLMEPERVLI